MVDSDLSMTIRRTVAYLASGSALAVLLVLAYWFGILVNWWSPVMRPRGVSANARYVFLWESAAWFDCSVDRQRDVDVCKAWNDRGRPLASGDFRLEGPNRAATESELHPSTIGRTGPAGLADEIYLFGPHGIIEGKKLIRVVPRPTTQ